MEKNISENKPVELITRKQAIKKAGFTALTAASLLLLQTNAYASPSDTSQKAARPGSDREER